MEPGLNAYSTWRPNRAHGASISTLPRNPQRAHTAPILYRHITPHTHTPQTPEQYYRYCCSWAISDSHFHSYARIVCAFYQMALTAIAAIAGARRSAELTTQKTDFDLAAPVTQSLFCVWVRECMRVCVRVSTRLQRA